MVDKLPVAYELLEVYKSNIPSIMVARDYVG